MFKFKMAFDGQVLIEIEGSLFNITLPVALFNIYTGLIEEIEGGISGAIDRGRADLHDRLREWWEEEYPHVDRETFDAALEKAVERRLGY